MVTNDGSKTLWVTKHERDGWGRQTMQFIGRACHYSQPARVNFCAIEMGGNITGGWGTRNWGDLMQLMFIINLQEL